MTISLLYKGVSILDSITVPSRAAKQAFILASSALNADGKLQLQLSRLLPHTAVVNINVPIAALGTQPVLKTDIKPWSVGVSSPNNTLN